MLLKLKYLQIILLIFLVSCDKADRRTATAGLCISFDDRSIHEWYSIRSLLNDYNAKVTFYVTHLDSLTPKENEMLTQLESDGHEIGSHGAIHVLSEHYIKENSYGAYLENEIERSIYSMKSGGFNPKSFAYPYGANYWFTDVLLLRKFQVLRNVAPLNKERDLTIMDEIYYDYDGDRTLFAIGIDVNSGVTNEMITNAIKRAINNKEVLMLYAHTPVDKPKQNTYSLDIAFLKFILTEAKNKGLDFYRMSDLVD